MFDVTLAGFGFAALRCRGGVFFGFAAGLASLSSLSVSELSSEDSELVLSILEDVVPSLIGRVVEGKRSNDTSTVRVAKKFKAGVHCDTRERGRGQALYRASTS